MIKIKKYETVEECLASFFRCEVDEVPKGYWEFTRGGKYHLWSMGKVIRVSKENGVWGWCEEKTIVHLWVAAYAKQTDILRLLAHEIGHMQRPFKRSRKKEETKAELYAEVAITAFEIMQNLIGKTDDKKIHK